MTRQDYIISFDLDDTLFDNGPVIKHAFVKLYEHMVDSYAGFAEVFDFDQFVKLAYQSRMENSDIVDYSLLRKIHIQNALAHYGVANADPDVAYQVFIDARQEVTLFEQTIPLLESLKSHSLPLIAISNGNADPDRIGLSGFFSARFNPTSVGYAKPDPRMYEAVCQQLNIAPEQLIHIGDCRDNDVDAARNAGCHSIWFNRHESSVDYQPHVQCLSQIHSEISKIIN